MSAAARLAELGLEMPPAPKPVGVYKPALTVGDMCYLSGHGPLRADGSLIKGRVGDDLDEQAGYDAAQQTGLVMLATLQETFAGKLATLETMIQYTQDIEGKQRLAEMATAASQCCMSICTQLPAQWL